MSLSASQYRRLCVVSVLPLFLLGFAFAKVVLPYPPYLNVLCQTGVFTSNLHCRNAGPMDGNFYKAVKKQRNTWFDVLGLEKYDHTLISASTILLTDVQIKIAELSMGSTSSNDTLAKRSTGMRTDIRLGHEISDISFIEESYAVLMCADLLYQDHGLYRVTCRGEERNKWITFSLSDADEDPLVELDRSIKKVYNERQSDYLLYRVMTYPILVYAFVIISALVWVTTKAIRYVKSA